MPRNEYFQSNPTRLDVSRSKMSMHPRWTGSWVTGKLVPIFSTSGIMPGDTVRMDVSAAIRSITPVFPVMDDCDITVEAFFVPHRLTLSRKSMSPDVNDSNHSWAAFLGAQDSLLNMPTPGDVQLPGFLVGNYSNISTNDVYRVGGLADCLGFAPPASASGYYKVNCLKPLAYYAIWNEYFRDSNTRSPVTYSIGDGNYVNLVGLDAGIDHSRYGASYLQQLDLAPVSRYHGYFGSALPWPQRNTEQVELPLGDLAPVIPVGDSSNIHFSDGDYVQLGVSYASDVPLAAHTLGWNNTVSGDSKKGVAGAYTASDAPAGDIAGITGSNLFANLADATAITINQLREKVQEQRWYEALARGGNKLEDLNYSMFGVRGPSVVTRPEYLGGVRIPISISQVASTSDSGEASVAGMTGKVGGTGAFSLTNMNNYLFTKSFTEHGTLMVVACVRVHDSFGQGVSREDTKQDRFEFYWPQFANLGEQAIKTKEIFVSGTDADNGTFGFQEAWAEYRMFPDQVTGHVRPGQDLAVITYANNFASAPTLKSFLDASSQKDNVDRTLQVTSAAAGFQWYGQFQFNITMTRPMPLYSIPGLIDHH